jgi:hypothetical protein
VLRLEPWQTVTVRRALRLHPNVTRKALEAVCGEVDVRVEPEQFGANFARPHDPLVDLHVAKLCLEYASTV